MHHEILQRHRANIARLKTDHRNGNGLDNRKANLRPATHGENMRNRKLHTNNASGFMGVAREERNRNWGARIQANGKRIRLGAFKDKNDAARAYDKAARELHGEFASLNFPQEKSLVTG